MEQNNFSFAMLIAIIRKRFSLLLIIAVVSIIGAAVFSGPTFIPPQYKSQAIVYPINIEPYGTESKTEQLLQLFQGNDIRDSLIIKFDLGEVYELNKDKDGFKYSLYSEFNDHVIVSKTNYESVSIEVYDRDPQRAKDMADEMIKQINYKVRKLHRTKALEHLQVAKDQMDYQQMVLDSVNSQLSELRNNNGLLDYRLQTERVTEGYLKMLGQTNVNKDRLDEVRGILHDLRDKGGVFIALSRMSEVGNNHYNDLHLHYQGLLKEVNQELSYVNVVMEPEAADKKSFPVRWLIVLTTTISTLLAALVILLLFEKRGERA